MRLRVACLLGVLGRGQGFDGGRIDQAALARQQVLLAEMRVDAGKRRQGERFGFEEPTKLRTRRGVGYDLDRSRCRGSRINWLSSMTSSTTSSASPNHRCSRDMCGRRSTPIDWRPPDRCSDQPARSALAAGPRHEPASPQPKTSPAALPACSARIRSWGKARCLGRCGRRFMPKRLAGIGLGHQRFLSPRRALQPAFRSTRATGRWRSREGKARNLAQVHRCQSRPKK